MKANATATVQGPPEPAFPELKQHVCCTRDTTPTTVMQSIETQWDSRQPRLLWGLTRFACDFNGKENEHTKPSTGRCGPDVDDLPMKRVHVCDASTNAWLLFCD